MRLWYRFDVKQSSCNRDISSATYSIKFVQNFSMSNKCTIRNGYWGCVCQHQKYSGTGIAGKPDALSHPTMD